MNGLEGLSGSDVTRLVVLGGTIVGVALLAKLWLLFMFRRCSAQVKARQTDHPSRTPDLPSQERPGTGG